jgi:pyridoxal phosphate enzyme (YggS family)
LSRLQENRSELLERVESCLRDLGRDPAAVRIVAVTKEVPPPLAGDLLRLGSHDLGENRADGLEEKRRWFDEQGLQARWHFVGHLQRNKARRVLRLADEIHSVDSLELLDALQRIAPEEGRFPGVYLQVKLVDEPRKSGLDPRELHELCARAQAGPLPLLGLMTIAPLVDDPAAARRAARDVFQRAAALARELPGSAFHEGRPRLSMGMTQDFEEALAAGADVLRIGSAFFEGVEAARESARNGR